MMPISETRVNVARNAFIDPFLVLFSVIVADLGFVNFIFIGFLLRAMEILLLYLVVLKLFSWM